MAVLRFPEIEEILTLVDRLGISREAVTIPLRRSDPGEVRVLPDQRVEIVVPESIPVTDWLGEIETRLRALRGDAGD